MVASIKKCKYVVILVLLACFFIWIITGTRVHAQGSEITISIPNKYIASQPAKEVRYTVTERTIVATLFTDGFKDLYYMEGGQSNASWSIFFSDGKHEYSLACNTPYNKAGSFSMSDMLATVRIKTGSNVWNAATCAYAISGNELTFSASLPESWENFEVTTMVMESYYISEYHDPNVNTPKYSWTLDADGKLIIRDAEENQPMDALFTQKDKVKSIDIDVTNYALNAEHFTGYVNLESATIRIKNLTGSALSGLFKDCTKLKSVDLSGLASQNVVVMSKMFSGCKSLSSINLTGMSTISVIDFGEMFEGCASLTTLDLSGFNTAKAKNFSGMFNGCVNLQSIDLSSFVTTNVTNTTYMFGGCHKLTSLDVSNFQLPNVEYVDYMFACSVSAYNDATGDFDKVSSLQTIILGNIGGTNTKSAIGLFYGCNSLQSIDVSTINTSSVADMSYMFYGCSSLTGLNVSNFVTVKCMSMRSMFWGCAGLTELSLANFDTSLVTDVRTMFSECSGLKSLDLSSFDLSKATSVSGLFFNCAALKTIKTPKSLLVDCALPKGSENWHVVGEDAAISILPKNLTTSVTITCEKNAEPFVTICTAQCGFEGKLQMFFNLIVSEDLLNDPGAYVEIKGVQDVKIPVTDGWAYVEDGKKLRRYCYSLYSNEMRELLTLRVYDGNGNAVTIKNPDESKDFTESGVQITMMQYAEYLAGSADEKVAALGKTMIDYGTASQIFFKYNAEGLAVSSDVKTVSLETLNAYAPASEVIPEGSAAPLPRIVGRTLAGSFESDNAIYVTYFLDEGVKAGDYVFKVDGNVVTPTYYNGGYMIFASGIASNRLDNPHTFSITKDGVEWKASVSMLSYAMLCVANEANDEKLADLGRAIYLYNRAADAYFGD